MRNKEIIVPGIALDEALIMSSTQYIKFRLKGADQPSWSLTKPIDLSKLLTQLPDLLIKVSFKHPACPIF